MRKKIDNRIRNLIENGVTLGHRSLFFIVGEKARDQVVILHHILSKAVVKSRPNVLWCYKKELGFSSHRKKRMKQLKKQIKNGNMDINEDDPFEFFISSTNIRYCYYSETKNILGNTYGICLLQDFEALTPNILAQTIETVEGGGLVIFLLNNILSLNQLCNMTMDIHSRYKTEAHKNIISRFNERFLLSLTTCKRCLVLDDKLNIIPISSNIINIEKLPPKPQEENLPMNQIELKNLVESFQDVQTTGPILKLTKTLDQAKALLKFVDIVSEKVIKSTICLTASRGRGKSACLGLSIATAIAYGYSNIFVTSPNPENLKTLFEFLLKGFVALSYEEHIDYETIRSSNSEHNKNVIRINVFKRHRQTIQYVSPNESEKLGQCELLVIDEAAAIPLPTVKKMLGPYICFMSSTVSGYEGTGRSLSLKLFKQLRQKFAKSSLPNPIANSDNSLNSFHELKLSESIRYGQGDDVEIWLNDVLCLSNKFAPETKQGASNLSERNNNGYICPPPDMCELYMINRDTLFSFHMASEAFLQKLVGIYVASHYKNSPNDLQMLSDAPAHQIFCLLGPYDPAKPSLPEILCVVQVCLEGELSKESVIDNLARGKKASGDLIPWNISQQFQDYDFPHLAGARIIRIATHPDYQRMGYGKKALQMLTSFYEAKIISLNNRERQSIRENVKILDDESGTELKPKTHLPPLLSKLSECDPIKLDYMGVSYGLTSDLLRFWKRTGFVPVYLRQTANELTGEHSCIMLKRLISSSSLNGAHKTNDWLNNYFRDFKRRFIRLLSFQFRHFCPQTALSLMQNPKVILLEKDEEREESTKEADEVKGPLNYLELIHHFTLSDIKRLTMYSQNLVDYHLIMDLIPVIAQFYFTDKLLDLQLTLVQQSILVGIGLQHKTVDNLEKELNLPSSQILGLFNRLIRRISSYLNSIVERSIDKQLFQDMDKEIIMEPTKMDLKTELDLMAKEIKHKQECEKMKLLNQNFGRYAIKGSEHEWDMALVDVKDTELNIISVGSLQKTERKKVLKKERHLNSGNIENKHKKKKKFKKMMD
ncbi:unnamed protein product [Gordionus sp. m RMFG-2023]|uniref:RNA cytidine acetyltransferase-like n=1 Tax=Gordionus sp. m RMFG-2023 TaxID=3053472 RepID=UPI0030DEC3AA